MLNPIFEASYIQQNKSVLNKILQELKNQIKSSLTAEEHNYHLIFNEDMCDLRCYVSMYLILEDVFLHEESDKVYILGKCEYTVKNMKIYQTYNKYFSSKSEVEERVLGYMHTAITSQSSAYNPDSYREIISKLDEEGITPSMFNGSNNDKELDILRKSKLFGIINDTLNEVVSMKFNTELVKKAVPRLKLRKGVVPLMWLTKETGIVDYPYTFKEYGSGIMATKYRDEVSLASISRSNCKSAIKYTPYANWLTYDFDDIGKIPNLDVAQTNSYNR